MNQNSLKRSFPVILKDEETGERTVLTEDGQKRVKSEEDEMHDAPNFDLPQDVAQPEDEMHDAEDSEIAEPEEMEETIDGIMDELFSDEVKETTSEGSEVDPMERWIAPTIEEESSKTSLQLSESEVRGLIQYEIRNLFGKKNLTEAPSGIYEYERVSHPNSDKWAFETPNYTLTVMASVVKAGDIRMPHGSGDFRQLSCSLSEQGRTTDLDNGPVRDHGKVLDTFIHLCRKGYENLGGNVRMMELGGGLFRSDPDPLTGDTGGPLETPTRRVMRAFPEIEEVGQSIGSPVFFFNEIPREKRRDDGRYERLD